MSPAPPAAGVDRRRRPRPRDGRAGSSHQRGHADAGICWASGRRPRLEGTVVAGLPVLGPIGLAATMDAGVAICTARPAVGCSRRGWSSGSVCPRGQLPARRSTRLRHCPIRRWSGPAAWCWPEWWPRPRCGSGHMSSSCRRSCSPTTTWWTTIATLASGVRLGGGVRAATEAYLGAGALVREGVTVGASASSGWAPWCWRTCPPVRCGPAVRPLHVGPGCGGLRGEHIT